MDARDRSRHLIAGGASGGGGDGDGASGGDGAIKVDLHCSANIFTKNRRKQVCLPMSSEDQTPEL